MRDWRPRRSSSPLFWCTLFFSCLPKEAMMYTYLLIIAFKLCPEVHIEQQNKNLPFWMIWSKIVICNWLLDHKAKLTLHLLLVYKKARQISGVLPFFYMTWFLQWKRTTPWNHILLIVDRKGIFFFTTCWTWVTSVPKGFSSCIPALRKMYRYYFVNLQKKKSNSCTCWWIRTSYSLMF